MLLWTPSTWATDYHGEWLDSLSLLITIASVNTAAQRDPAFRASTGVGALQVSVLPSGNLTSLDGTSDAMPAWVSRAAPGATSCAVAA